MFFSGLDGDRIDLSAFGSSPIVSFASRILNVNGEAVASIVTTTASQFDLARDLIVIGEPAMNFDGTAIADIRTGLSGNDTLRGRAGDDSLDGRDGNDTLWGDNGNDTLIGGAGDDELAGHGGDDVLRDGPGLDTLIGGQGVDRLILDPFDQAIDRITLFSGVEGDRIDLTLFGPAPTVSFAGRILTINGEAVAEIEGLFDPARDLLFAA